MYFRDTKTPLNKMMVGPLNLCKLLEYTFFCMFFVIIYYSIYLTNNEVDVVLDEDGHGPP